MSLPVRSSVNNPMDPGESQANIGASCIARNVHIDDNELQQELVRVLHSSFPGDAPSQANYLYANMAVNGHRQSKAALDILLGDSRTGRNYRFHLMKVPGFPDPPDCSSDAFFYAYLVPELPEASLGREPPSGSAGTELSETSGRVDKVVVRLARLRSSTAYMLRSLRELDPDLIDSMLELNQTKSQLYFRDMQIYELNGIGRRTATSASTMSFHQRKALLWRCCLFHRDRLADHRNKKSSVSSARIKTIREEIEPSHRNNLKYLVRTMEPLKRSVQELLRRKHNAVATTEVVNMSASCGIPGEGRPGVLLARNPMLPASINDFALGMCNTEKFLFHGGRYVRIGKSANYPMRSDFFIGGHCFPAVRASDAEEKMIEAANGILMEQIPVLRTAEESAMTELPKPYPINGVVTVMKKFCKTVGFSAHNDASHLLIDEDDEISLLEDIMPLPKRHLLQVITFVFVYPATEHKSTQCRVEWLLDGKRVGVVTTTGNFMHMQLWGMNDTGMKHNIKYAFKGCLPNAVRITLTFRRTVGCNPADRDRYARKMREQYNAMGMIPKGPPEPENVYIHSGVLDSMLGVANVAPKKRPAPSPTVSSTRPSKAQKKARRKKNTLQAPTGTVKGKIVKDTFSQLTKDEYLALDMRRPNDPLRCEEDTGQLMANHYCVSKLLLENHTLLCSLYSDVQVRARVVVKADGSPYKLMEAVDMGIVADSCNVTYNQHQHDVCASHIENAGGIFLSYAPKNDVRALLDTRAVLEDVASGKPGALDTPLPDIVIFGSGGGAMKTGSFAVPDLDKCSSSDQAFLMERAQKLDKCNLILHNTLRCGFAVSLFASDHVLGIKSARRRGESGRFVGLYYFKQWAYVDGLTREELSEHVGSQGGRSGLGYRFLLKPHFVGTLGPVKATSRQYADMTGRCACGDGLRRLHVPWRTRKNVSLTDYIRVDDPMNPVFGGREVYEGYVTYKQSEWEKYYVSPGNNNNTQPCSHDEGILHTQYTMDAITAVTANVFCSVASAYRYLGQSLIETPKKGEICYTARPLVCRWQHWGLGAILQCTSFPASNRCLDVLPMFQAYLVEEYTGLSFGGGRLRATSKTTGQYTDVFRYAVFVVVVTRFSGCPNAFLGYGEYVRELHGDHDAGGRKTTSFPYPSKKPVDDFVAYLTQAKSESGRLRGWISRQHFRSLPVGFDLGKFVSGFLAVLDELLDGILASGNNRRGVDLLLRDALVTAIYGSSVSWESVEAKAKELPFLCTLILGDLDELFTDAFGEVTFDVFHFGPGSRSGLKLISTTMGTGIQAAADAIVGVINALPKPWLTMLGLSKNNGTVVNAVNGRPIGYYEVDEYACKCAKYILCTHPSRLSSQGRASLPYNHPYPFGGTEYNFERNGRWGGKKHDLIMSSIAAEYEKCLNDTQYAAFRYSARVTYLLVVPPSLRLPGENSPSTKRMIKKSGEGELKRLHFKTIDIGVVPDRKSMYAAEEDTDSESDIVYTDAANVTEV